MLIFKFFLPCDSVMSKAGLLMRRSGAGFSDDFGLFNFKDLKNLQFIKHWRNVKTQTAYRVSSEILKLDFDTGSLHKTRPQDGGWSVLPQWFTFKTNLPLIKLLTPRWLEQLWMLRSSGDSWQLPARTSLKKRKLNRGHSHFWNMRRRNRAVVTNYWYNSFLCLPEVWLT